MPIKKDTIFCVFYLIFVAILLIFASADYGYAGGGPEEGTKSTINAVPEGYKIVPIDDDCKHKDPCAKEKAEIAKLKAEIKRLQKEIVDLPECEVCKKCPKQEVKTVYVDKIKEMSVEKRVEVEKPVFKKNVFKLIGAIGQDGLDTSSSKQDEYARDAEVYYNGLGGIGYTRFFDDTFGLGLFGILGGTNKTAGLSLEFAF
jgi:hypothetical protein